VTVTLFFVSYMVLVFLILFSALLAIVVSAMDAVKADTKKDHYRSATVPTDLLDMFYNGSMSVLGTSLRRYTNKVSEQVMIQHLEHWQKELDREAAGSPISSPSCLMSSGREDAGDPQSVLRVEDVIVSKETVEGALQDFLEGYGGKGGGLGHKMARKTSRAAKKISRFFNKPSVGTPSPDTSGLGSPQAFVEEARQGAASSPEESCGTRDLDVEAGCAEPATDPKNHETGGHTPPREASPKKPFPELRMNPMIEIYDRVEMPTSPIAPVFPLITTSRRRIRQRARKDAKAMTKEVMSKFGVAKDEVEERLNGQKRAELKAQAIKRMKEEREWKEDMGESMKRLEHCQSQLQCMLHDVRMTLEKAAQRDFLEQRTNKEGAVIQGIHDDTCPNPGRARNARLDGRNNPWNL
ncbi:hypothetical protein CYMTET_37215, partial [Cymbomonas tetramitiformis]